MWARSDKLIMPQRIQQVHDSAQVSHILDSISCIMILVNMFLSKAETRRQNSALWTWYPPPSTPGPLEYGLDLYISWRPSAIAHWPIEVSIGNPFAATGVWCVTGPRLFIYYTSEAKVWSIARLSPRKRYLIQWKFVWHAKDECCLDMRILQDYFL